MLDDRMPIFHLSDHWFSVIEGCDLDLPPNSDPIDHHRIIYKLTSQKQCRVVKLLGNKFCAKGYKSRNKFNEIFKGYVKVPFLILAAS
jgi:hypothetical protein